MRGRDGVERFPQAQGMTLEAAVARALRALDLLSVNRTVNQFDIYVGTSAGAFIASPHLRSPPARS